MNGNAALDLVLQRIGHWGEAAAFVQARREPGSCVLSERALAGLFEPRRKRWGHERLAGALA